MSAIDEIISAIRANDWKRFHRAVVRNTQSLNNRDASGGTPLGWAVSWGYARMVKELIRRGANVNYATANGSTPVYSAAAGGHTDMVRVLIELKADVNKANNDGWTPLHASAWWGHMATVKYLVEECHTEINTKNSSGDTPISIAKRNGRKDVAEYLERQLLIRRMVKMVMEFELNILPFYAGVRGIIVKYLK